MNYTSKSLVEPGADLLRLMVVGRDSESMDALRSLSGANAWHLENAGSGCEALERLQVGRVPDLVVVDLAPGDQDGMYALRWLRRVRPTLPIVLLGFDDDVQRRDEAMRLGASEFLHKPIVPQQLEAAVRQHLNLSASEEGTAAQQIIQVREDRFFVSSSPVMRKLLAQCELLAQVDVPLLVVGESGSGKETVARLIHKLSVRSGFTFVKINCAALPADLLERELFGYESGTFSAAGRPKPGKLELAEKGTIFLDDIADMPLSLQAKLLYVLQEKQFSRPGSGTVVPVDVRLVAATSVEIDRALTEKRLREDLFYRLSAFTVHVPALRQRREEIPLLLGHFLSQLARHYSLPNRAVSQELLASCQAYSWPGNLRELESFAKRYLVMGQEDLGDHVRNGNGSVEESQPAAWETAPEPAPDEPFGLRSLVQNVKGEAERNAIAGALEQTRWNRKAAARLLKVSYRTLLYKIQQYHMTPPPAYASPTFAGQAIKGNGHGS